MNNLRKSLTDERAATQTTLMTCEWCSWHHLCACILIT